MNQWKLDSWSSLDAQAGYETIQQGNPWPWHAKFWVNKSHILADQVAMRSDKTKRNSSKKETKYLVSHRSPFVQLEEPFAVLFWTSSWTMLYKCSYFDGSEEYFVSSLWQKRIKSIEIKKKKITWNAKGSRSEKWTKQEAEQSKVAISINYLNIDNWKTTLTLPPTAQLFTNRKEWKITFEWY